MPGTIQDPRMNPRKEERYGIAYFDENFDVPDGTADNPPGHYFYEKQVNKEDDFQSSRFFPHGFPVEAIGPAPGNIPNQIRERYERIFCNLNPDIILFVGIDRNVDLDEDKPMAAYLHRVIAHGKDEPAAGRGLKKFNRGRDYRYNRDFDDIGILELD